MPGEVDRRVGQRPQPLLVEPVGVEVVAPAKGLCDGGLQPGVHVRRQFVGPPAVLEPLGDQGVGLLLAVVPNQRAKVLGINVAPGGFRFT